MSDLHSGLDETKARESRIRRWLTVQNESTEPCNDCTGDKPCCYQTSNLANLSPVEKRLQFVLNAIEANQVEVYSITRRSTELTAIDLTLLDRTSMTFKSNPYSTSAIQQVEAIKELLQWIVSGTGNI